MNGGRRSDAPVEPGRLLQLIDALAGCRVVVAGDLIADEFIYGEIARVSREAPVLILNYDSTEVVPGGAGNAAANVAALGGSARAMGQTGRDEAGLRLLAALRQRKVDVTQVLRPASTGRRPRHASSPAAFIRRSSRWCASIARRGSPPTSGRARPSRRAC